VLCRRVNQLGRAGDMEDSRDVLQLPGTGSRRHWPGTCPTETGCQDRYYLVVGVQVDLGRSTNAGDGVSDANRFGRAPGSVTALTLEDGAVLVGNLVGRSPD
jgi:hypothetical protein